MTGPAVLAAPAAGPGRGPGEGGQAATAILREVVAVLDTVYPRALAEPWDAVGLVWGDLAAPVRRVMLAVDVVEATVDEAVEASADLLVAHHPLFLRPVHGMGTDTPKGRLVHRLATARCALFTAHTNADSAAPGVSDALARVLGLTDLVPLALREPGGGGAGGAAVGLGRVGRLGSPVPLRTFAEQVARALPRSASGVRVAGPDGALVERVAVCGGAGDSLLDDARRHHADVFVTADLRHHVASEAVAAGPPWLVDVAHWASEWPWLLGARERLLATLDSRGRTVEARVSALPTDPWTMRL